jgi:hypothetical protein
MPGIVKAVRGCKSSPSCICQNLEDKLRVEKMLELALPMSPIHSVISFIDVLVDVGIEV